MSPINKKKISERDICTQFISPAIQQAGWGFATQVREEVSFTAGQVIVQGKTVKRGNPKRADYILYYRPNLPIAVVEAKDNNHAIGAGMQQALDYADDELALALPFVFSSNGDGSCCTTRRAPDQLSSKSSPWGSFPPRRNCGLAIARAPGYHARTSNPSHYPIDRYCIPPHRESSKRRK